MTENHVPSTLDNIPRASFKEMDGENDQNDPFGLDCVPDIDIQGSIPCTSMHHTCKYWCYCYYNIYTILLESIHTCDKFGLPPSDLFIFLENSAEFRHS